MLAAFVALQRRVANPLLPLRVVTDRNRGGSYLAIATAYAGVFGMFLFLTFYLQNTKGMTAIETGLAFLPMSVVTIFAVTLVQTRILARTGPRPLIPTGLLLAGVGMALLTRIGVDTAYVSHVLPSLILVGIGFGLVIAPSFATATLGVPRRDSGVASAMVSTSQQVGGSIGTALLSTMAVSATTDYLAANGPQLVRQAAVEGYTTAFWWAAAIFAVGALITGSLLRSGARPEMAHRPAEVAA
jgi:MFS family permease